jgi:hypothetical protein
LDGWAWGETQPGETERLNLKALRAMQWLVWRLSVGHGLWGWTPGFIINASASYNFSDAVGYEVIDVAGGGFELLLELRDETGNVLDVQLWAGRTPEPEIGIGWVNGAGGWGLMQPGDILEFHAPCVLAYKSRPMVVRLLSKPATRRLWVEVDRDCSHALTVIDDSAHVYVSSWREAGDLPKWNDSPHLGPEPTGTRCVHARRDFSQSLGNLGISGGVAVNDEGEHWYCALRTQVTQTATDTDDDGFVDTYVTTRHTPSGVATFPASGFCAQLACDRYQAIGEARWVTKYDCGQAFQQIWCATDLKLEQGMPGISSPRNWKLSRIETPSIAALLGHGVNLHTPAGMHAQTYPLRVGGHGNVVVWEDIIGQHVRVTTGHAWDVYGDATMADPPPAGSIGPTAQHDSLDYMASVTLSDVNADRLQNSERLGSRVMRDTGERTGRGYARWSHAEPLERWLVIPRVRFGMPGTFVCGEATVVVLAAPVTIGGTDWGGYIEIAPIIQAEKTEIAVCTRTTNDVTALGSGRFQIDLENVQHQAGFVWGDSGATFDRIYTWLAGGGPGTPAECWAAVHNYYEGGDLGSPFGGLARGDSVSFDVTVDGQNLNGRRFIIEKVWPHGGSEAATWGVEKIIRRFVLGGCWTPSVANTAVTTTPDGESVPGEVLMPTLTTVQERNATDDFVGITTANAITSGVVLRVVATGELVQVYAVEYMGGAMTIGITRGHAGSTAAPIAAGSYLEWVAATRQDNGAALQRVQANSLPSLSAGQWWWDILGQRAHFAAADAGVEVALRYGVSGQQQDAAHCYAEAFEIVANAEFQLDLPTDIEGIKTWKLLPDGASFAPDVIDNAGIMLVRSGLQYAGRMAELVIATGNVAEPPPDGVSMATDYADFAKKRDRIIVRDESGLLTTGAAALENISVTGWWSAAKFMPLPRPPQWVAYGANDWSDMSAGDWLSDHSAGRVWLKKTWMTAQGENERCLRL